MDGHYIVQDLPFHRVRMLTESMFRSTKKIFILVIMSTDAICTSIYPIKRKKLKRVEKYRKRYCKDA